MEYWLYIIFISCHKTKLNIGFGIAHTFERNNMSRDSSLREKSEGECYSLCRIVLIIEYSPTEIKRTINMNMFQDLMAGF